MTSHFSRAAEHPDVELEQDNPRSFQSNSIHRIHRQIQIQIPPQYAKEPVISAITTRYELEVNILSALLATNAQESGWFDLDLWGTPERIEGAIQYLAELRIEILRDDAIAQGGWSFQ